MEDTVYRVFCSSIQNISRNEQTVESNSWIFSTNATGISIFIKEKMKCSPMEAIDLSQLTILCFTK